MMNADFHKSAFRRASWLLVGAVTTVALAILFYYTQDVMTGSTRGTLKDFWVAQTPTFFTFVFTLSAVMFLESLTVRRSSNVDILLRIITFFLFLWLFYLSMLKVAKSSFYLLSDLYRIDSVALSSALSNGVQPIEIEKPEIREALNIAKVTSINAQEIAGYLHWLVVSFLTLCVFRYRLTLSHLNSKRRALSF